MDLTLTFDGHRVRMAGTPERPEWVAKDVCRVLQVHHTADALRNAGVSEQERGRLQIDTPGGPQQTTTIVESALWKLVIISRRPAALRFRDWLATEVLPSIRRHGCFPPPPERAALPVDLDDPGSLRGLVEAFAIRRLADIATIAKLEPKAAALDVLAESDGECSLQEVGRHLGLGPNRTIWQMEEDGLLFRGPHGTLTPRADLIEAGHFRFVTTVPDESGRSFGQTKVTRRGLVWLATRYRKAVALVPGAQSLTDQ